MLHYANKGKKQKKHNMTSLTIINDKEKQIILTFKKVEPENVRHLLEILLQLTNQLIVAALKIPNILLMVKLTY